MKTIEEEIKKFEDKWNVVTQIFSSKDVSAQAYMWRGMYPPTNPTFTARFKDRSYFYARYNEKRITYPLRKLSFNTEFIKEFKILAKRIGKELINDD